MEIADETHCNTCSNELRGQELFDYHTCDNCLDKVCKDCARFEECNEYGLILCPMCEKLDS